MTSTWSEAIKEAYASAPSGVVILNTLELSHPSIVDSIYLVQDYTDHECTLEDGVTVVTFRKAPFRFVLPSTGSNGLQELNIAIDNVDQAVSDFLQDITGDPAPVTVKYRSYLSTDKTEPQNGVPLVLFMSDIQVTPVEVVGRASFADIINRQFLSTTYTVSRFPGLA